MNPLKKPLSFILWSLVFGIAYTQAPLYYSNQNQYFLHGLADAGLGFLQDDWLANSADPTPVFSFLVYGTFRFLSEPLFYVYYILILGIYFHALLGLYPIVTGSKPDALTRLVFITLLVAIHAGLLRLASARLLGVDYPWYFQSGLAGQYVLGFGLQPSVFGVLLLASIHAFVHGCPWRATFWACLGAIVHATYLPGAAFLILSYQYSLFRAGRVKEAILLGLWALVLVAPVVAYNLLSFAPTSVEEFRESQHILAHFRIPHHAEPARWFDTIAACQVGWMVLAMVLVRKTKLFPVMVIPFGLSLLLTLLQIWTGNDTLALLFPWRTSAVLVPLATAINLAALVHPLTSAALRRQGDKRHEIRRFVLSRVSCLVSPCLGAALAVLVAGGIAIRVFELGYPSDSAEIPMMDYVNTHKQPGQVYLLPVQVPKLGSGKPGAYSTNFMPAPRRSNSTLIAIDLQRFRLLTGTPLFVDFKSIPYEDREVLEWHRRLFWTHKIYTDPSWTREDLLAELRRHRISHVVSSAAADGMRFGGLERIYEDGSYRIYKVGNDR